MPTNTQPIIIVENLSRSYNKGNSEIRALDGVSFSIETGEFISIVGKSGSGKSTLLNLIGGLDRPTEGRIIFNGIGLETMTRKQLSQHRKHSVGMVFQSYNLIPSRNAWENITLALAFGGMPRKKRFTAAVDLLTQVSLNNRIYHKPAELSGGESQRVAIARAMANDPGVLLADEPTGNLDSQTAGEILSIIGKLNLYQGKTVVMVTHDLETAIQYSDRIIWLKDGKIEKEIQNTRKTGHNPEEISSSNANI
jgi:putative ABC transport system ATP-binding protein